MNVLDEIVAAKRQEIAVAKEAVPLEKLEEAVNSYTHDRRSFRTLFDHGPALIAEVKPKSPSKGELSHVPLEVADVYAKSAADAISVLTDERYFGGSMELLKQVRSRVKQPILRKDFIIDEYQVFETLLGGADAFLLIVNVLSGEKLTELMSLGTALGLDYIVEVHDKQEVEIALDSGAELIGINNRNLQTLDIDIGTTKELMEYIPRSVPVISESGIETVEEVRQVRSWGVKGILVGTSILQSPDPLAKIQELKDSLV